MTDRRIVDLNVRDVALGVSEVQPGNFASGPNADSRDYYYVGSRGLPFASLQ